MRCSDDPPDPDTCVTGLEHTKAVTFMLNGKGLHFAVINIVILVGLVWIQTQILYANVGMIDKYLIYTSEIRRSCLMKLPSEILYKI